MVTAALDELGLPFTTLHQRRFADAMLDLEIVDGQVRGQMLIDGRIIDCADVSGIYTRLMDWRVLPELAAATGSVLRHCQRWHEVLTSWIEIAPGCVMNRAAATASNQSKPYQAQLIRRAGFRVPETLVTNDPELVRHFRAVHGQVVYKSISGTRSIVRMLDDRALRRLPLVRWCPVQFQRYVTGTNVRVHAVAGQLFATRIETDRVDYRYAGQDGGSVRLTPDVLSDGLSERCLALVDQLGLELAGIDLLLADDGETYCFEVNPSPAYSFYEHLTGQPIARAIALSLGGRRHGGEAGLDAATGLCGRGLDGVEHQPA
ncbi:ATP-grasp domain-containing protein [Micromonospora viridifaciens]|nr:ATP-grasp domain-containing protein [Micromonospora viridifaciens]